MARIVDYPDIVTHRNRSILPPELQTAIAEIAEAIRRQKHIEPHLSVYQSELRQLPPRAVARAADEIRGAGRFYRRYDEYAKAPSLLARLFPKAAELPEDKLLRLEMSAIEAHRGLAWLFIFHGDGRIREAALRALPGPPESPFAFAALSYRLNDWAEPVRAAARDQTSGLFPATDPGTIAHASFFLLEQINQLERWEEQDRQIVEAALYRTDVLQALADRLMRRPQGSVGKVLRLALRKPGLDPFLPVLASEALMPAVRAIALDTLVRRRASWFTSFDYEWVDKRYGRRRRVPVFARRPVEHDLDIETLLTDGASDASVNVRKVAAQAMVDLRHDLSGAMKAVAESLSKDTAATVRSRAKFFLKSLQGP